jgi:hypothetical protein
MKASQLENGVNMALSSQRVFEQGEGVLKMAPNWVPRSFCIPGKRLKLHPADLYAYGAHRGGIDERWFASCEKASNGPHTLPDEGLSYVVGREGDDRILFKHLVMELGADLLGSELWNSHHEWPVFAKFFDNQGALPHHLHHRKEHAEKVGLRPKPEAYYFPAQMNNHLGDFPYTFFGLEPGTTRDDLKGCLERWNQGDNGILFMSRAYRLELNTGWDIPAGILHAPGSLCTYEPQWASDIGAIFQSLVNEKPMDWNALVGCVPEAHKHDLDYIVSLVDWEANTDPAFRKNHLLRPRQVKANRDIEGLVDLWIVYGGNLFCSKETTILPGASVVMKDPGPYSLITVQGQGNFGVHMAESPALIRFGQQTSDEFFVSAQAAREGVLVRNSSSSDPLVFLKTFGPGIETD